MKSLPEILVSKLKTRKENNSFRVLDSEKELIDFSSNDYLGFASNQEIKICTEKILSKEKFINGSTGSRLVSGTHNLHNEVEGYLANYHNSEAALLYNSGYDANIGLFSSVLQKGTTVLYDELIHASIRDGIRMSNAKSYKFKHNSVEDLQAKFSRCKGPVFIVVESVYSMDGDSAPLMELVGFSQNNNCYLIVDEAHSGGVFGDKGEGLLQELDLENEVFARIHTFGKALGCHGAVVLGNNDLRSYLINFSRSFIYTTAASLHSIATIKASYLNLETTKAILILKNKIAFFKKCLQNYNIQNTFIPSESAVQCCVINGNNQVKRVARLIEENGFSVKAILSPTVPEGEERLRICLHAFNSNEEIQKLVECLSNSISRD